MRKGKGRGARLESGRGEVKEGKRKKRKRRRERKGRGGHGQVGMAPAVAPRSTGDSRCVD